MAIVKDLIVLGSANVAGNLRAASFKKDGGTANQFLKADGSVDESTFVDALQTSVTWSELKTLRDSSGLTPGMQYRVTDYQTRTVQEETQSAGHQFDVIVMATDVNKLSEEAKAIQHSSATTDYFYANKLEAWKIWYCLDNDTTRFRWADSGSTGRGVIYRMIDEFNNDCPYDFKNIQFTRKLTDGVYDETSGVNTYVYTFNAYDLDNGTIEDASKIAWRDNIDDGTEYCFSNVIKPSYALYGGNNNLFTLNNIVFLNLFKISTNDYFECYCNNLGVNNYRSTFGSGCYTNSFGYNCGGNIFGDYCYNNTFGDDCGGNTFGNGCSNNAFGYYCYSNKFGDDCFSNTFRNDCYSNTFGHACQHNTFGNYFGIDISPNTFGYGCSYNTFGDNCLGNTFGNGCSNNTFGNKCENVKFGNNCIKNTFGNNIDEIRFGSYDDSTYVPQNYYQNIKVEDNNYRIYLTATIATDENNWAQNITLRPGTNRDGAAYKQLPINSVNDNFTTTYHDANDVDELV